MRHFLCLGYKQIKRMMVSLVGGTDIRKQEKKTRVKDRLVLKCGMA